MGVIRIFRFGVLFKSSGGGADFFLLEEAFVIETEANVGRGEAAAGEGGFDHI